MPGEELYRVNREGKPGSPIFAETDLLPLSRLADLEFCPRRAALHLVEMIWEDNVHTADGSIMHERAHGDESPEKRGDLVIVRGLWLRSLKFGLSGKADIVELHRADNDPTGVEISGHSGRWKIYPIEYKPGRVKHQRSFQIQLCAQAFCLEEMLHCEVSVGAIYYGKNRRRLEIYFDDTLRAETAEAAARLHELVRSGKTPPARYEKKCESCSLVNLCLPKVTGAGKKVGGYLSRMLAE